MSPEQAAEAIIKGVHRNSTGSTPPTTSGWSTLLQRYFPPRLRRWLMRGINVGANRVLPEVARAARKEAV